MAVLIRVLEGSALVPVPGVSVAGHHVLTDSAGRATLLVRAVQAQWPAG